MSRATKARRMLLASYPRDRWLARVLLRLENAALAVIRKRFRAFVHAPGELERAAGRRGLTRSRVARGMLWETAQLDDASGWLLTISSRTAQGLLIPGA